ncbi:MAG TPA: hypothetical protein VNN12_04405, partial [Dehalococcoidia bacterium]|nr:hypothetical protein [Dehalococcoidia bacterium]
SAQRVSTTSRVVKRIYDRIQEGPVEQDAYVWWRLGGEGWAVQDYLRYPEDAPLPQDTPTPQPTEPSG